MMKNLMLQFPPEQIREIRTAATEIADAVSRFQQVVSAIMKVDTADATELAWHIMRMARPQRRANRKVRKKSKRRSR